MFRDLNLLKHYNKIEKYIKERMVDANALKTLSISMNL